MSVFKIGSQELFAQDRIRTAILLISFLLHCRNKNNNSIEYYEGITGVNDWCLARISFDGVFNSLYLRIRLQVTLIHAVP
jgi:hypothetical protein